MFFSGQGPVFVAPVNGSGVIGALFDIGNLESFQIGFEPNVITDKESKSGNRLVAARIETELTANMEIVLKEPNLKNLEAMFRSAKVANIGASVVDEVNTQAGLAVGDYIITKFQNISAVTVKDSAGSPLTLVLNTDYVIESLKFGRIRLLTTPGAQPYKVSYTHAARTIVPLFNAPQASFFVHMEGINTVDSTNFLAQFYNIRLSPPTDFPLLNDEFGRYTLSGEVLIDPTREGDPNFGRFGRLSNPI